MSDPRLVFEEHRPNPGYCLVIRPMKDPRFEAFWDEVATAFHRTFAWKDVGSLVQSGDIMDAVLRQMAESDVIVADVSLERANVFYELGIAHARKGPEKVVLVTGVQGAEPAAFKLPFDVQGMRTIRYDPNVGMDAFLAELKAALFASLEGTTWFHLATNGKHSSSVMPGDDGSYVFEVKVLAITGEERLKNEGVDAHLTVRLPPKGRLKGPVVTSTPVTLLRHDTSRREYKIPHLPWRLRSEGHDTSRGELEAKICIVPDRS